MPDVCLPKLVSDGVILAGAGAGKTTATVALHLAAVAEGLKVLVITFTNATVSDYIKRANKSQTGLASRDCVYTFHKLAAYILQAASAQDSSSQTVSLDTVVALAVESVVGEGVRSELQQVRAILVDESQDCSKENYELVRAIAKATGAVVVMIGDANQSLYRFRNASPEFLLSHVSSGGGFTHVLSTNWRSSPEIVALTNQFMRHPVNVRSRPGAEHGPLPKLLMRSQRTIARDVVDMSLRALAEGHTVMVVGRSKRPRYEKGALIRVGLQMIVNEMQSRNAPHARLFREASDDDGGDVLTSNMSTDAVNVMTIHGSKGLESDVVVVVDAIDERVDGQPSEDQMELMYVALSRARSELMIVNSSASKVDVGLQDAVRRGLCIQEGDADGRATALDRETRDAYSVTQILSDRTIIGESDLLDFSRELAIDTQRLWWPQSPEDVENLPDVAELRTLYGTLAENCVQMIYNSQRSEDLEPPRACVIDKLSAYASRRISIPASYARALSKLYSITGARRSDPISRSEVTTLKAKLVPRQDTYSQTIALLDFVLGAMHTLQLDSAVLTVPSSTQRIPVGELRKIVSGYHEADSDESRLPFLFSACMFFYQLDHHAGYRWGKDYSRHVRAFSKFLGRITRMTEGLPENCAFERTVHFRHLKISGRTDACSPSRIIEFKFTGQLGLTHFMQPCVYAILDGEKFSKRCEVWNLATAEKVLVRYDDTAQNRWRVFRRLALATGKTVTVDDMERCPSQTGRGVVLSSRRLRIECEVESEAGVSAALQFVTSRELCLDR